MKEHYLDMLMNDHALIEKALLMLEKESEKSDESNSSIINTLLDFLWDYGDLCHNMKEEKVYFPMLLEKGLPPQGPVGVMLQEHKEERRYLELLRSQVQEKESIGYFPQEFNQTVKDYSELTKGHIWKENDILYPIGKKIISGSDEEKLAIEFIKIEKSSIGEGGYLRYMTLINTLEKRPGGRVNLLASLPTELIGNMLDALPIEISYVDADDRVRYFNKLDKKKIFARTLGVVGRTVQQCHPEKSVHLVNKIIREMKESKREQATFWINFGEMFVHISYFAVRNEKGDYQGCVEMVHDIKPYRDLEGEKRLLDEG